jgi:hypothetical protein
MAMASELPAQLTSIETEVQNRFKNLSYVTLPFPLSLSLCLSVQLGGRAPTAELQCAGYCSVGMFQDLVRMQDYYLSCTHGFCLCKRCVF